MTRYILPSVLIVAIASLTSIAIESNKQAHFASAPIAVETVDDANIPVVTELAKQTASPILPLMESWKIPKPQVQSQDRPPIDQEIDEIKARLTKLESKYSTASSASNGSAGGGSAGSTGGGSTGSVPKVTYKSVVVPYQQPVVQVPRASAVVTYQCNGNVCVPVTSQTTRTTYRRFLK